MAIAKRIAGQLEHNGAEVTLTRKNDSYVSLEDRVHISNPKERKQANSKSYQNKTAKAFVTALEHYFNKT